jgi:hypothetical protein
MRRVARTVILLLCLTFSLDVTSPAIAGEQRPTLLRQYWGQIRSVRIDKCGRQPGLCVGSIVLARREGGEVTLAIRPGTWIKRGDQFVLLEDLRVGHDVHVQAAEIAGTTRVTDIDVLTSP